jgi:hypothetical protein
VPADSRAVEPWSRHEVTRPRTRCIGTAPPGGLIRIKSCGEAGSYFPETPVADVCVRTRSFPCGTALAIERRTA